MIPKVFILSSLYDFSADLVCLQLNKLEVPFTRINKEQFIDYRFEFDPINSILNIKGLGLHATICEELVSVWFRQPVFLRNTPAKPLSPSMQLQKSQWMGFLRSIAVFNKAAWMNFPQATYIAECKPYQLSLAIKCGFSVPSTLVTNSADAVKKTFNSQFIIKSLDTVLLTEGEDCLFTYTTASNDLKLTDSTVSSAPLLAQEYLINKKDIRVTVIGNKLNAVYILSGEEGIEGDWRVIPREELNFISFDLPSEIRSACIKLVEELELSFGAIDLIETQNGFHFIEINPTGEWAWLTDESRSFDKDIASWLAGAR